MTSVVPTGTVSPAGTRMRATMPVMGDGSSLLILSVSTSASISPSATRSPSCLCQAVTVPSSMVRPHLGRITFSLIGLAQSLLDPSDDFGLAGQDVLLQHQRERD